MKLYYKRGFGMLSTELVVTTEYTEKEETVCKNEQQFLEELMYAQWPRDKRYSAPDMVKERYSVCNVALTDLNFGRYSFEYIDFSNCMFNCLMMNKNRFMKCTFTECIFVNCTFVDSSFSDCTVSSTTFDACNFKRGSFNMHMGSMCSLENCTFDDTNTLLDSKGAVRTVIERCYFLGSQLALYHGIYVIKKCGFSKAWINDHAQKIEHDIPLACPVVGSFIAYKVALSAGGLVVVTLRIPEDAKRSSCVGHKCRASKAEVLDIKSLDGKTTYEKAYSNHSASFAYQVGDTVEPQRSFNVDTCTGLGAYDENRFNECSTGIHFFLSPEEAIDYAKEHF